MIRITASLGASLALLVGVGQQPVFRTSTVAVFVDVAVRQNRTSITTLKLEDFLVYDNGVLQDIELLTADQQMPLEVSLLLDSSESVAPTAIGARGRLAAERLTAMLGPADKMRIISFASGIRAVPDVAAATAPLGIDGGHTSLWEAMTVALLQPLEPTKRRFVIVVTDGFDTSSVLTHSALRAVARRTDAVLHVIAFPELWAPITYGVIGYPGARPEQPFRQYSWLLDDACAATGGALHVAGLADDDFLGPVVDALGEFRKRYLFRYTPRGVEPGGWHRIEVKVPRSGDYQISARQGYHWR